MAGRSLDWKYLLGLKIDDPGFDHTVLPEFRAKVAEAGLERVVLDALLERLKEEGLVRAGGKQRSDSTHVAAAVAALNRLELAGESVRALIEALAAAHPAWTKSVLDDSWMRRYGTPVTSWRPPMTGKKRDELAIAYAKDGYQLLGAVYDPASPALAAGDPRGPGAAHRAAAELQPHRERGRDGGEERARRGRRTPARR